MLINKSTTNHATNQPRQHKVHYKQRCVQTASWHPFKPSCTWNTLPGYDKETL